MTDLFTPEHLHNSLHSWFDGQDPNGNDRASLPSGDGVSFFQNKGKYDKYLLAINSNVNDDYNATRPQYLYGGSIVKLEVTNQGAGYSIGGANNGVITDFEINKSGQSFTSRSKVLINISILNGQVQNVASVGGSFGYAVGDVLTETSDQNGGQTNAEFTVTEVTYRGGFLFNSEPSRTDFFRSNSFLQNSHPLTEMTFYVACNLRSETDTNAYFSIEDLGGYNHLRFMKDTSNVQAYSEGFEYKEYDENDYNGGATYNSPAFNVFEGNDRIFMLQLSQTVTGKFQLNGGNFGTGYPTMRFPDAFKIFAMNDIGNDGSKAARGTMYEMLVFDRILDSVEHDKVIGYLEHKYKLDVLPAAHPYKTSAPTVNTVPPITEPPNEQPENPDTPPEPPTPPPENPNPVIPPVAAPPTPDEESSGILFNGAHLLSPRKPLQMVEMFLDFCDNEYGNSDDPSTCEAAAAAGNECYNTRFTCQDPIHFRTDTSGKLSYKFFNEVGEGVRGRAGYEHAYPALVSVTSAPVEIIPTKGVSVRANVTIKLRDFFSTGADVDPYFETRDLIAIESGSYFQKLMQRNPYYIGRTIRVYDGFVDHLGNSRLTDGKKEYVIDSMALDKDILTIKCKDPMTLGDDLKSKVPAPSGFSLKASIGHGTESSIVLQIGGADATAAELQAEYGTSGFVRIEKEILAFTRSSTDAHITFHSSGRGEWGTKALVSGETYDAGELVQNCVAFGSYDGSGNGVKFNDVAYELLVNQAKINPAVINNGSGGAYSWADEKTLWLNSFRIDAIFSEPKEINRQLAELGSMVGVNLFYEDRAGMIVLKAETPELDTNKLFTITDSEIVEDSLKFINSEKERISRVYYYYNLRDHTEDRDKPKNYRNLYVNIDSDGELPQEYGKESNKTIFGYGISDSSTAITVSQRLLSRFKATPKTVQFEIDVSKANIKTGSHFNLNTRHIVDESGIPQTIEMQCLSIKLNYKKQSYQIKAKQFRFGTVNTAPIAANNVAAFSTGGGSGTEASPYTGIRKTTPYLADANQITAFIVDGGEGFQSNQTITLTPAESASDGANTRNLTISYSQTNGKITSVTVTSNTSSGSIPSAVHDGYAGQENLTGVSSTSTQPLIIRITKQPAMSGGQEPYRIS